MSESNTTTNTNTPPKEEWLEYPPRSGMFIKKFGIVWNYIHQQNLSSQKLKMSDPKWTEHFYNNSLDNKNNNHVNIFGSKSTEKVNGNSYCCNRA